MKKNVKLIFYFLLSICVLLPFEGDLKTLQILSIALILTAITYLLTEILKK